MGMIISDGSGLGPSAKVGADNRLYTNASAAPKIANASLAGKAYSITTQDYTVGTTHDFHLYVRNDDAENFIVANVLMSWNGGSTNFNRDGRFHLHLNPTLPTANDTAVTPTNLNLGGADNAQLTVKKWDGVGSGLVIASGGNRAFDAVLNQGVYVLELGGALILPAGASLGISAYGGTETGIASINLFGFFEAV